MHVVYTIEKEHQLYRKLIKTDDRCDRCGAEACYRAILDKDKPLELLLCGHHFRSSSYKLGLDGWLIQKNEE
jgi:ribosomal protein S14